MSIEEKVLNYKKILSLFPNTQEKYQYLIEEAKENANFPRELRIDISSDVLERLNQLSQDELEFAFGEFFLFSL